MATLKDKFSKGLTTINVKTNNFMEQNKINTYISTMEHEIRDLKIQLGELVYTNWKKDGFDISDAEDILHSIHAKYEEIAVQKRRIEQIFVEEQQILGTTSATENVKEGTIFCNNCGAPSAANFKFCAKCGSPL